MENVRSASQSVVRNPQAAVLPICIAGMDACWIFAVAWLFSHVVLKSVADFPVPPAFVLALFELGGWGLMLYLLDRTTLSIRAVRTIVGAVGLLLAAAVALVLSPFNAATYSIVWILLILFPGLICLTLWFLGGHRAVERITYEDIYANFRLGVAAISASALLSTMVASKQVNELWTELGGVGIWFFIFGLAGLALGNREAVRRETGNAGMKGWGWMAAASVAVILLIGTLGQAFGGKDILSTLQGLLYSVVQVVAVIVYGLVYAILWPLSLFGVDIGPIGPADQQSPPSGAPSSEYLKQLQKNWSPFDLYKMPVELQTFFMVIAAILVVAAVLYALSRWLRRTRADRPLVEEEERVGFGSWSLLVAQIKGWFRRLFGRFRKPSTVITASEEDDLAALQGNPHMVGTLSVRQIYARLLKLAGSAGYPRAPYQTPAEYLRFLSGALPNLRPELNDITSAYIEARYGPSVASPSAVQAATAAWRRAEPALQSEIRNQKTEVRSRS